VVASALVMGGCAPLVSEPRLDLSTPPAYEAKGAPSIETVALDQWWRGFGDAQLDNLVERALTASSDARLALARLEEARAIRAGALSGFRLQGDLNGAASATRTEPASGGASQASLDSGALTFNLSWEADLFGRKGATRQPADQDLAAARFVYEGSRAALAADVADTLLEARGIAAQLADAETSVGIQQELFNVLRARADRGLAAETDVARVKGDLGQTQAQAVQLAADLQGAKRALLVLIGAPQGATADLPITPLLADGPRPPATFPGELLERRPDVREAEARFRAAIARADLQRLELFPRLTLEPGVGLTAVSADGAGALVTWTLGASVFQPILDRPRLLAALGAQNARAAQAAIAYERAVQTAFSEADQALVQLDAGRSRVALLTASEQSAAEAYAGARERFGRGLEDLTTTLDAERTWRAARLALSSARIDALRRTVTSFRALGGGWTPFLTTKDKTA